MTVLIWVLALTPIGYIPLFEIDITLMCIPVIVGACALGLPYGLFLGLMFAFTSLFMALMGRSVGPLLSPLLNSQAAMYLTIFVPRLLIPVITWIVYKSTKKWYSLISYAFSALAGSFANTVFFLGFVYVSGVMLLPPESYHLSNSDLLAALIGIAKTSGVLEAAVAVIVCVPVLFFLKKMSGRVDDDS